MRIARLWAKDAPPIRLLETPELADVVVLAGPNGVGKTRLLQELVQLFRNPGRTSSIRILVEATAPAERESWGKGVLDTSNRDDAAKLQRTLQGSRRRASWSSSVVQFESDRTIQRVDQFLFTWDFGDPWEETYSWEGTLGGLRSRFQDTIHSLFRKVQSRRDRIGRDVEEALRSGPVTVSPGKYPDPLEPFRDVFSQLLAPKALLDVDLKRQQLMYSLDGKEFAIETLSAGEREVVNIVFDFLLRKPEDCIVLFDEPELHLHPELSYRLLQTLRSVGTRNQFIFCTHSADIITASLDQSVIFLAPPKEPPENQAVPVREDDETNQALRLLGHSIGIIALGRKLVLIEGASSSLDKQLYGTLLRNRHPGLVLVPSGGKGAITSFATVNRDVLQRTLWGVEFYMLCDRDAVPFSRPAEELRRESGGRLQVLSRYHLENYFLESAVIAQVFAQMECNESALRSPNAVDSRLREIARSFISYAVALTLAAELRDRVGNLDIMPREAHGRTVDEVVRLVLARVADEQGRIAGALQEDVVEARARELFRTFEASLELGSDRWRIMFPGKPILATFASETKLGLSRLKMMYIRTAETLPESPFREVTEIFDAFAAPEAAR